MYCGTLISDESHLFKEFASDESYTSCNREVIAVIRIGGWWPYAVAMFSLSTYCLNLALCWLSFIYADSTVYMYYKVRGGKYLFLYCHADIFCLHNIFPFQLLPTPVGDAGASPNGWRCPCCTGCHSCMPFLTPTSQLYPRNGICVLQQLLAWCWTWKIVIVNICLPSKYFHNLPLKWVVAKGAYICVGSVI